jgi:hypothetical protein
LEEMRKTVGERKEGVNRAFKERKKKKKLWKERRKEDRRLTIGSPRHSKSNVAVFGKVTKNFFEVHLLVLILDFIY